MKHVCYLLAIAFSVTCSSSAQQPGRIESVKLLTAQVGWAATTNNVFWTTDGGASWKDLTPKTKHNLQAVAAVFFLNPSTGWVLLHCGEGNDAFADDSCFELASTYDSGRTWSAVREKIVKRFSREQLENGPGFSGRALDAPPASLQMSQQVSHLASG
jgi:hypothetical protein